MSLEDYGDVLYSVYNACTFILITEHFKVKTYKNVLCMCLQDLGANAMLNHLSYSI